MTLLHPLIYSIAFVLQWVAILVVGGAMSFGFVYFGYSLQRASFHYAEAERMETLEALYSSVNWGAVVESANRKREDAEERLARVCKKSKSKVCL